MALGSAREGERGRERGEAERGIITSLPVTSRYGAVNVTRLVLYIKDWVESVCV